MDEIGDAQSGVSAYQKPATLLRSLRAVVGDSVFDRAMRTYATSGGQTSRDVVYQLPRATHPWPASGSIARSVTGTLTVDGTGHVERTVSRNVTVNWEGSIMDGRGTAKAGSGAFSLPVSFPRLTP